MQTTNKTGMFHRDSAGNIPVLVIFAPTAAGKTALVHDLFSRDKPSPFAGQAVIISADSMQVYRRLNIGTAKPDAAFLEQLPHKLIDLCSPHDQFGSGEFVHEADNAAREIIQEEKLPVLCGGTAFYLKNFIFGLPTTPEADSNMRELVERRMESEGAAALWAELRERDPESAAKIHVNDEYRIKRALEVVLATGKRRSDFVQGTVPRHGYAFLVLNLTRPREELYQRIDARVDAMFEAGLAEEVAALVAAGYTADDPGLGAIGYREFFTTDRAAFATERDWLDEVKRRIKHDTHRYAKRQETFFKPLAAHPDPLPVHTVSLSEPGAYGKVLALVEDFCAGYW